MPRGARLAATLLVFCTGGCVDLSRPPELDQPRLGDAAVAGEDAPPADGPDNPVPQPTGTEPDAGPDAGAPDAPEPDAAVLPDAADAGADLTADGADAGSDGRGDGGDGRAADAALVPLVIDDFADGTITPNAVGAPVKGDNQVLDVAAGELSFRWNGASVFQSFGELLSPDSCAREIGVYRTFRFRMRASVPGKDVKLSLVRTNAACNTRSFVSLGSISPTTTMTVFKVDLQTVPRDGAASFEWVPPSPPGDMTVYTIDDIELLP